MEIDLEDPRLITLEEMLSQTSIFPAIASTSVGKATNNLIKSLLSNLGNHAPSQVYGFSS
jgi:hypothetical protein